ncbi:hypothetical protein [Tellurirhabdus rosea]|uniref:hypothetical protein n=1 Tax=Tellurirhabdus rosea TaxID=2674997 RepID=UPI0022520E9E|nr:hypothetical protein [Tellurirhabdus rosea]
METKNLKYGAVIGILLSLGYWVVSRVRAATRLDISMGLPKGFKISGGQLTFIQPIVLLNRTQSPLTITLVDLDFNTESGSRFGRAFFQGAARVPPYQNATVDVTVTASLADLAFAIPDLITGVQAKRIGIKYAGSVGAEGFSIRVADSYFLTIPKIF